MDLILALFVLLPILFSVLVFIVSVGIMVWTTIKGISRLRFSLRELMLTVVSGGTCVTLLANQSYPLVGLLGLVCTSIYVTVLISHVLALGGAPATVKPNALKNEYVAESVEFIHL